GLYPAAQKRQRDIAQTGDDTQQQRGIGHHLIKENGKDVVEDCHNTLPMVKALNAPYAQHFSLPTLIIKNNHNKIEFD
ncbi:hypothetical protein AB2D32_34205, partial [Pseudomonas aeruginosa]